MQLVALKNLGFSFGEGWIFRNLNLEIQQGDFIAVIGANGAGKSTLLRVIAHILPATEGDVFLFGESLQRFRNWKKIGYVPQNPARQQNSFHISVREVVQLGRLMAAAFLSVLTVTITERLMRLCRSLVWKSSRTERWGNFPVGSNNACFWLGQWLTIRTFCCWMSRPPVWIQMQKLSSTRCLEN